MDDGAVAHHYHLGDLEDVIMAGIAAAGLEVTALSAADLTPVDEFHLGGAAATSDLTSQLGLTDAVCLLDVGCGIGGPARHVAAEHGCEIVGVDLTDEHLQLANRLNAMVGLDDLVRCERASALALPYEAESFDGAYMLHVGMNIEDKARLCAEVARVLRPGGFFAIYDVMRVGPGEVDYPLPWASTPDISFVEAPARYRELLEAAGFMVTASRDRREFAIEFVRRVRAASSSDVPPPLGLHLVMGADFGAKMANLIASLTAETFAPVEVIAVL
ncbi:MAG TPA: methyltransferase domain-containing protein [Acidimicrobiia bacterium]|nr:methyltransferase domain-containing protein [Acidimicrobiia bacterium]